MGANAKKRREQVDTSNLSRQQKIDAVAPKGGGANKIVIATALAILAIVAIVGTVIWNGTKEKGGSGTAAGALPKGVATKTGPVRAFPASTLAAKAPTIDIYEDFQCPACQQFESVLGGTVKDLAKQGKARVNYHVMTFIDNNVKNDASNRATNGALCAADQGKFEAFHDEVYANAPANEGDGWTDEQLAGFAQKVGVNMTSWNTCVKDKAHQDYIDAVQTQTAKDGVTSTPTIKLNGQKMDLAGMTPEKFTKAIEGAAK